MCESFHRSMSQSLNFRKYPRLQTEADVSASLPSTSSEWFHYRDCSDLYAVRTSIVLSVELCLSHWRWTLRWASLQQKTWIFPKIQQYQTIMGFHGLTRQHYTVFRRIMSIRVHNYIPYNIIVFVWDQIIRL